MKEIKGNLWDYHTQGSFICIMVNCTPNSRGNAIMGKGIAKEAVEKFPQLPKLLGSTQIEYAGETFFTARSRRPQVFLKFRLITFPTKVTWDVDSSLIIIEHSCRYLVAIVDKMKSLKVPIYLPKPGVGNGNLEWESVQSVIEPILDERFIVCDLN